MRSNDTAIASAPVPFLALLALSLAAFASGMSLRITDAQLPRLATDFSVSLGEASYVITSYAVAYGVMQLFFGPLGDRFGKCLVVAYACAACAITAMLCALAPDFQLLLVARLLAGATAAAVIPLSMAWIGDVIPYDQRQPILARYLIGQIMGVSAGVLVGGLAADYFSWRVPFFGISILFALIAVTLFRVNRRLPPHAKMTHRAEGGMLRRTFTEFGEVMKLPWARVVLGTVFLEGVFLYGVFAFIASHLHKVHGVALSLAGMMVMLFGFGGLLFALVSKLLVERLGEVRMSVVGGILMLVALTATGLGPAWWWSVPGCFVTGLGFYMLHNTLQINATQMAPQRRGAAVSAFASFFFLGQSVGVGVAGLVVEHIGTSITVALGGVGVVLLAVNFGRLRAQRGNGAEG